MIEASLEGLSFDGIGMLCLELSIWQANFTMNYEGNFQNDFPDGKLYLYFDGIVAFSADRLGVYKSMETLAQTSKGLANRDFLDHGARTVESCVFEETPDDRFSEVLVLETGDSLIRVEFLEAEISARPRKRPKDTARP